MIVALMFQLLPRRDRASALFPYTTLFRSCRGNGRFWRWSLMHRSLCRPAVQDGTTTREYVSPWRSGIPKLQLTTTMDGIPTDRKSTRLNSSHVAISYAVICLKKKKNNHIE